MSTTTVNACDSLTGWSLDTNGVGTGSIDTGIKVTGTGSIKYVRTVDKARNWDSTIRLNVVDEDWSNTKKIRFWVRTDKAVNDLSFRLVDTSNTTIPESNTRVGIRQFPFQTTQAESYLPADTWYEVVFMAIGADLSNVKYVDIYNGGDQFSGWSDTETVTIWIDDIRRETGTLSTKKWVVVDFDDGYKSVYQNAFPIMQALNQRGTFSIATDAIDGTHYLGYPSVTSAEVLELHNAGWDIGGHSDTHANLQSSDQSTIETEITNSSATLQSITGQAPTYMSLPFNAYDELARTECIKKFKYIGRGNTGKSNPYSDLEDNVSFPLGRPYQYELTRYALSESYDHDLFVRIMDDSFSYGRLPHITFHSVADDGSPVYTTVEKFEIVMNWLNDNGWSVVPATQMYNEMFKSSLTINGTIT